MLLFAQTMLSAMYRMNYKRFKAFICFKFIIVYTGLHYKKEGKIKQTNEQTDERKGISTETVQNANVSDMIDNTQTEERTERKRKKKSPD